MIITVTHYHDFISVGFFCVRDFGVKMEMDDEEPLQSTDMIT